MEPQLLNTELQALEKLINKSDWLARNDLEPNVGDIGCPQVPKGYGTRGQSLYTAFITEQDDGVYKCAFVRCFAQSAPSLEDAIRHIRKHHFNHFPFPCLPTNGDEWYVSHCSLFYSFPCTRRRLTWFPLYSHRRFHAQIDLTNHQTSTH